jgi:hypothetical protein
MSNYGWTYLSRDALRRAEHQLSGAGDGVRDEIGFLIIHQRYADYFFPGTSVLHMLIKSSHLFLTIETCGRFPLLRGSE